MGYPLNMITRVSLGLGAIIVTIQSGFAILSVQGSELFDRDIRPILSEHCFPCHGPDAEQRKAKVRLDTRSGLFGEGENPGPFVPGAVGKSVAMRRILSSDPDEIMPPPDANHPLSPTQIDRLKRWVEEGAVWERHWAFEPITEPTLPVAPAREPVRNEIDAFIRARLVAAGLEPAPEASRRELIRRLSLDLHGLPPSPEAIARFQADPYPDAYERLVAELLASPKYGERMVWEWLDAARYADSNGYQADRERTMWPWRDWAIDAFNRNLPLDVFTVEQLAGDLLPEPRRDQILATGFNRNHMINGEGGRIPEENRIDYVMDMAETVGTVWLGLTMNCCRCHDHKFDPLSQRDYYGLFAFFNQTPVDGSGGDPQTAPVLRFLQNADRQQLLTLESEAQHLDERIRQVEASHSQELDAIDLSDSAKGSLNSPPVQRSSEELAELAKAIAKKLPNYEESLRRLQKVLEQRRATERRIPKVMVMADREEPRESFLLTRGLYNKPTERVGMNTPSALPPLPSSAPRNRLGLARWLVSPDNPLTARVFVNRQWARFFGQGLVRTVEDFGTQGERPSHPLLLDWLAHEFIHSGWDIKRLHRIILSSATYRQSSKVNAANRARDPDNRLFARGARYRMPSWMIRDQALAASGLLVDYIGGPPVKPYQPDGVWSDFTFGKKTYQADSGEALYRRSVYTFWRRIIGPTMFFDTAKRQSCVVKEARTNTPLHALSTLNDVTYIEASRALAGRVMRHSANVSARIDRAFLLVTGHVPDAPVGAILRDRFDQTLAFYQRDLGSAEALISEGAGAGPSDLDRAELAAYTTLCHLILNLDETLSKQ